jgi:hypothetical protein
MNQRYKCITPQTSFGFAIEDRWGIFYPYIFILYIESTFYTLRKYGLTIIFFCDQTFDVKSKNLLYTK